MIAQNVGFWIIAVLMVVSALRVVTTNNVVHAALWLVVVLAGAAGQYILLAAEFVAITQVLVYIGAVMVLFLFGTMLTRARIGAESDLNNSYKKLGIPVGLVMLVAMGLALTRSFGDEKLPEASKVVSTLEVSDQIFGPYLLPFWALTFAMRNGSTDGHTFALYIIAVAAAEVGVGLGLVLLVYRNKKTISVDDLSEMRG